MNKKTMKTMRLMACMLVATLMMALPQGALAKEIPYLLTAETLNSKSAGTYTENTGVSTVSSDNTFYLVGNFFGPNKFMNDSGDGNNINYSRRIFQFTQQSDGSYAVKIPATVTAKAQILSVDLTGKDAAIYGPGPGDNNTGLGIHANTGSTSGYPTTNGSVTGTLTGRTIASGTTLSSDFETSDSKPNYWNLTTRNNNVETSGDNVTDYGEDDGTYTFSFTLGTDGVPTKWTIKHNALTRSCYMISTAKGATVQRLTNKRSGVKEDYNNVTDADVYIESGIGYYFISNVALNHETVYLTSSSYGTHKHKYNESIRPTANKLFYMGNGNHNYSTSNDYNQVSPNEGPVLFGNQTAGNYTIEYNPSNGNFQNATTDTHLGMRGQIIGVSATGINTISMVGNAIPGTLESDGTTWDWDSNVADMTYDYEENCYKLTINTTAKNDGTAKFRFVANHDYKNTFGEESTNEADLARVKWSETGTGHSALPEDPNKVKNYTSTSTNMPDDTYNIIFNREPGLWTVRFYIVTKRVNGQAVTTYHYTIDGTPKIPVDIKCYITGQLLRTYSNNVDLVPEDENLWVYAAQRYDQTATKNNDTNSTIKVGDETGTVVLYRLKYIPKDEGVLLYYNKPDTIKQGYTYTFNLLKASYKDELKTVIEDLEKNHASKTTLWVHDHTATNSEKANKHGYDGEGKETWNNEFIQNITKRKINSSEYDDNGNITKRNFALNILHNTKWYKNLTDADKATKYPDKFGFYRLKDKSTANANNAVLQLGTEVLGSDGEIFDMDMVNNSTSSAAKKAMIWLEDVDEPFDNTVTEIKAVETIENKVSNDNAYYNLQGMRVANPTKGIYIHNGKKVIIK